MMDRVYIECGRVDAPIEDRFGMYIARQIVRFPMVWIFYTIFSWVALWGLIFAASMSGLHMAHTLALLCLVPTLLFLYFLGLELAHGGFRGDMGLRKMPGCFWGGASYTARFIAQHRIRALILLALVVPLAYIDYVTSAQDWWSGPLLGILNGAVLIILAAALVFMVMLTESTVFKHQMLRAFGMDERYDLAAIAKEGLDKNPDVRAFLQNKFPFFAMAQTVFMPFAAPNIMYGLFMDIFSKSDRPANTLSKKARHRSEVRARKKIN